MRVRAETLLIVAMSVFALTGMIAAEILERGSPSLVDPVPIDVPPPTDVAPQADVPPEGEPLSARAWFGDVRPYCNPVDVESRLRWQPAPDTDEGRMHEAACFALAGKIDRARASIERLPTSARLRAAEVVFAAGHPAADSGDELAAGPLMELVVEYSPRHYMALYHAGAARFERGDDGDHEAARDYLTRFLALYPVEDFWRDRATAMLEAIGG